jgi:Fe-S cluster assembly scaffold protein SufB
MAKTELLKLKSNQKVKVSENTQFVLDLTGIKGDKEITAEFIFEKPGVEAEVLGVYCLGKGEKLHLTTVTDHIAPNTSCTTTVKGVLHDNSISNYTGKILIDKKAQQTSSFLNDSVLVVGENTKNVSEPILEIEANDVKASHGATTGRINEDQMYYLKSRGLGEKEAQNLIIEGFFESVLSKVEDASIKEYVRINLC